MKKVSKQMRKMEAESKPGMTLISAKINIDEIPLGN
jgi:hypothetical protein